jgi:hypothetical protein
MGREMTVLEQVSDFLKRQSPKAFCDDCIASRLKLTVRQHANHKTRELAAMPFFDRREATCAGCGDAKLVIAYTRR